MVTQCGDAGTEGAVGEAVKQSGIPRKDLYITTKLPWVTLLSDSRDEMITTVPSSI
jgi:diketogulonate reductase-like aldo/keto reductase